MPYKQQSFNQPVNCKFPSIHWSILPCPSIRSTSTCLYRHAIYQTSPPIHLYIYPSNIHPTTYSGCSPSIYSLPSHLSIRPSNNFNRRHPGIKSIQTYGTSVIYAFTYQTTHLSIQFFIHPFTSFLFHTFSSIHPSMQPKIHVLLHPFMHIHQTISLFIEQVVSPSISHPFNHPCIHLSNL